MKHLLTIIILLHAVAVWAQKSEQLFNGKDLTGWRVHGTEKWYVQNGEMICESGTLRDHTVGVVIQTNRITFYDFILENEVTTKRTPTKKRKNKNH